MRYYIFAILIFTLFCQHVNAAYNIPVNDAISLRFNQKIGTVFISQPAIADYKVVSDREIILYASAVGEARIMVYNVEGKRILTNRVKVNQPLDHVLSEVKARYPELTIDIRSVGTQTLIKGQVYTEKQRDEIYALVAGILGKEVVPRWPDGQDVMEFPEPMLADPKAHFYRNFTYQGIMEELELSFPYQVNVKTTIAQVSSEFSETVGVDWGSIGASTPGVFTFPNLTASDIAAVITALSDDSLGEVLAEPNLTVLSGEEASFLVGGELPMVVSDTNGTEISFKEFGIGLDLSAKVLSKDEIRLRVQPRVSNVDKVIKTVGLEVPQLSSRRVSTTIEIADGQTFMIGGLMSSEDIEQLSKVPLLGDIPLFGTLFSKATTDRKQSEVVIIATVNLVKPTSANQIQLPRIQKTSTLERLTGLNHLIDDEQHRDLLAELVSKGGYQQ
jgi:pilus assembly protein CpaC